MVNRHKNRSRSPTKFESTSQTAIKVNIKPFDSHQDLLPLIKDKPEGGDAEELLQSQNGFVDYIVTRTTLD